MRLVYHFHRPHEEHLDIETVNRSTYFFVNGLQNESTIERIMSYMDAGAYEEAETLAALADYLEECYLWDVQFDA